MKRISIAAILKEIEEKLGTELHSSKNNEERLAFARGMAHMEQWMIQKGWKEPE